MEAKGERGKEAGNEGVDEVREWMVVGGYQRVREGHGVLIIGVQRAQR